MNQLEVFSLFLPFLSGVLFPRASLVITIIICTCLPQYFFNLGPGGQPIIESLFAVLASNMVVGFSFGLATYSVINFSMKLFLLMLPIVFWIFVVIMVGLINNYQFKFIVMEAIPFIGYAMLPATFVLVNSGKINKTFYLKLLLNCFVVAALISIFEFTLGMGVSIRDLWVSGNSSKGQIFSFFGLIILFFHLSKRPTKTTRQIIYFAYIIVFFIAILINLNRTIIICSITTLAILLISSKAKTTALNLILLAGPIMISIFFAFEMHWLSDSFFLTDRFSLIGGGLRSYEYTLASNIFKQLDTSVAGFGFGSSWYFGKVFYSLHSVLAYLLYKSGIMGFALWIVWAIVFIKHAKLHALATYTDSQNLALAVILLNCLAMSIFQNKFSSIYFTQIIGSVAGFLLANSRGDPQ